MVDPSDFSICTIYNDPEHYAAMRKSFEDEGFASSQFLAYDNSNDNQYDPYRVISQLMSELSTLYILYCHQDVRLDRGHGFERLAEVMREMDALDPRWAVLGNAGSKDDFEYVIRITDNSKEYNWGKLPARVHSLDENFLVIKRGTGIRCSDSLSGFHLYATDLCLNAMKAGHNSYVIDFHVNHLCKGIRDSSLEVSRISFVERWSKETPFLFIRTPVLEIFMSRSKLLGKVLDSPRIRTWLISHNSVIRPFQRWPRKR